MFVFSLSGYLVCICQQLLVTGLVLQEISNKRQYPTKLHIKERKRTKCVVRDNSHELKSIKYDFS